MKQSREDHASLGIAALTFADKTRAIDGFQNFVVRIFIEITNSLFSSKAILYNKASIEALPGKIGDGNVQTFMVNFQRVLHLSVKIFVVLEGCRPDGIGGPSSLGILIFRPEFFMQ
jgi:hypothetical protein